MILTLSDCDIDLSKVMYVGKVRGDPAWLRYAVRFVDGFSIDIYERITTDGCHMPRKDFVAAWKNVIENKGKPND